MSDNGRIEESLVSVKIMGGWFLGRIWIRADSTRIADVKHYAEKTVWGGSNLARRIANDIADNFLDDVNAVEIRVKDSSDCELTYNNWP